ncbi:MAG: LamG-like jellyroll fold domain-containing protein [Candidatus Ornithomonoglobus sp.]
MVKTRKILPLLMSAAMLISSFGTLTVIAEEPEFPEVVTITPLSKPDSSVGVLPNGNVDVNTDGAYVGFGGETATARWRLEKNDADTYVIRNENSGKVMAANAGKMTNGTSIIQWSRSEGTAGSTSTDQTWVISKVTYNGSEYYKIVNAKDTNQSLSVQGDTGDYCILWGFTENSTSQLWSIEEAEELLPPAMPEGYAAYYSFDNGITNSVTDDEHIKSDKTGVIDASKVDNTSPKDSIDENLTLKYSTAHSKSGKSLNLTDEENPMGVALDYMIPANTSYTVSYWAKATRQQDKSGRAQKKNPTVLFDASDYTGNERNYLYSSVYSTYNEFIIRDGHDEQYGYIFGKEKAGCHKWQMYTYTYDASTDHMYLYINGQLVEGDNADKDVNKLNNNAYLYIGVNPWSKTDGAYAGYIDELYIYEKALNAEKISAAYAVLKDKGEVMNSVRTTIFTPTTADSYRCGVVYGRGIELQYQANEEDNGKLIATSEYYSGTRMEGKEYFPIFQSTDGGAEWTEISGIHDTENNLKKFIQDENGEYTVEATVGTEGAKSYYNCTWSMRHQPHLYEMPVAWAGFPAGTVLCAGLTASVETTATDTATDFDGNLHTRIDVYYSTDACKTWNFLGHVADGGESRVDWGDAIWEPCLIYAPEHNKVYCFYSDERGFYEKSPHVLPPDDDDSCQILVAEGTSDGRNWSEPFDVVNYHEENNKFRPGMPVVTRMVTGEYVVAYEGMGMGDWITFTYYKISDGADIEKWKATETDLNVPNCNRGSPYCCTLPTGEVVFGAYGSENVFVNSDNLKTNTFAQYSTGVITGYSRSLFPMSDGRLLVVSGGRSYPNYMQTLQAGAIDIGLCKDDDEELRVGTDIPERTVPQREKGIKTLYPSINSDGKVQFWLNQYVDEPSEKVHVKVTNTLTEEVYEDDVTMRKTAAGTRFNGARLNTQTVVTSLSATDITKCTIEAYKVEAAETEIAQASLTTGNAEFVLKNAADYESADVYVAEYTYDDVLVQVASKPLTIESDSQQVVVPFEKKSASNKVTIFVWKNMEPLTQSKSVE